MYVFYLLRVFVFIGSIERVLTLAGNECSSQNCQNGPCMASDVGKATCCCPSGCSGPTCDSNSNLCTKLGGQCTENETCDDGNVFDVGCCNKQKCCLKWDITLFDNTVVKNLFQQLLKNRNDIANLKVENESLRRKTQNCTITSTDDSCIPRLKLCKEARNEMQVVLSRCQTNSTDCVSEFQQLERRIQFLTDLKPNITECGSRTLEGSVCRIDGKCRQMCSAKSMLTTEFFPPDIPGTS